MKGRSSVLFFTGVMLVGTSCGGGSSSQSSADEASTSAVTTAPPTTGAEIGVTNPDGATGSYTSVITDETVDNPAFDALEKRIQDTVTEIGLPGASLLVVHSGELVEQQTWGEYTLDTKVPIASASKWFSGALLMTLVDDGLLELDEPVQSYVAELQGTPHGRLTLRQMLSFTTGLVSEDRVPCYASADFTLQECVLQFVKQPLAHQPGAQYRYHSGHLMMAGALAELVTGQSFEELFQERIAVPLGMSSTRFLHNKDPARTPVTFPNPAGGAVSTLGDYARFLEMLVNDGLAPNGTRILTPESIAEMETNQTEGLPMRGSAFRVNTKAPYGLGHWIDWTYPDGSTMVDSSPGKFGFRGWIDRANGIFGVYMVVDQSEDNDPDSTSAGGSWIYEMSAEAVGGSLPPAIYPHRR